MQQKNIVAFATMRQRQQQPSPVHGEMKRQAGIQNAAWESHIVGGDHQKAMGNLLAMTAALTSYNSHNFYDTTNSTQCIFKSNVSNTAD